VLDLVLRGANLPDGRRGVDIACGDGRIVQVGESLQVGEVAREIDTFGCLVTPPFVDSHFHLDSTLSYGRPRVNRSGTLLEGIAIWGELKPEVTAEDIKSRARALCHWAIAKGNLAIRSHVDICDTSLMAVLSTALDMGVDVVGGIPHFERTMAEGARSVELLCELAAERGLPVDMHCDESDDPQSRHIETLALHTRRLGLEGRVTGSHLSSMHSMDNYYVSKLLGLIREAGVHAVANPLINITLQGRHDSYPKRRGMTRVKEMMAAGINVSFGHDCVMDPWYPLGSHDMLEVAHMGLHVAQMTGTDEMRSCFDAVTVNGARTLGLADYGLEPGCHADLVVLQAGDCIEALRTRANRLWVVRRGRVLARTPASRAELTLGDDTLEVDFRQASPAR
jgi:cytosine deaminase